MTRRFSSDVTRAAGSAPLSVFNTDLIRWWHGPTSRSNFCYLGPHATPNISLHARRWGRRAISSFGPFRGSSQDEDQAHPLLSQSAIAADVQPEFPYRDRRD